MQTALQRRYPETLWTARCENVGRTENVGFPYTMLFAPFPCALSSLVLCCAVLSREACVRCVYMNVELLVAMASWWSYVSGFVGALAPSMCSIRFLFECSLYGWWSKCEESVGCPIFFLAFFRDEIFCLFITIEILCYISFLTNQKVCPQTDKYIFLMWP